MSYKCEWCDKSFSTKYVLNKHTKTAIYCLKLRGETDDTKKYDCDYCPYSTTNKGNLVTHNKNCSKRQEAIHEKQVEDAKNLADHFENLYHSALARIHELEVELAHEKGKTNGFEKGIEQGASVARPINAKATMNNNLHVHPKLANIPIDNIPALTESYIRSEIAKNYTYEIFLGGKPALAEFIVKLITRESNRSLVEELEDSECDIEVIVERNFACTDVSRNKFYRLAEKREWETDGGGKFLHKIFDALVEVARQHYLRLLREEGEASIDEKPFYQMKIDRVKSMYFGIDDKSSGIYRDDLFGDIRGRIKNFASV